MKFKQRRFAKCIKSSGWFSLSGFPGSWQRLDWNGVSMRSMKVWQCRYYDPFHRLVFHIAPSNFTRESTLPCHPRACQGNEKPKRKARATCQTCALDISSNIVHRISRLCHKQESICRLGRLYVSLRRLNSAWKH